METQDDLWDVAVIGGGPAGLAAAEMAVKKAKKVAVFEGMQSVGRKLLVAGRGGLNLTHGEEFGKFIGRFSGPEMPAIWGDLLADFPPAALRKWAAELGIATFEQRTGRVYPQEMKAAPLLRRWVTRLKENGVVFHTRHRWCGLKTANGHWRVAFADGEMARAKSVVFALGGGSWPRTGSTGEWLADFRQMGIACADLRPANCGWEVDWPAGVLAMAEGKPLKNLKVKAGHAEVTGELMVTRYGLEGGAIYALGAALRSMPEAVLTIDFKPTFSAEELIAKLAGKSPRSAWKLSDAALAVLDFPADLPVVKMAERTKNLQVRLTGPRPLAEAISSAGGVCWNELDDNLMLIKMPGVFVAGEMIDWEAPTGGYLMQGCFVTGRKAGGAAADFTTRRPPTHPA